QAMKRDMDLVRTILLQVEEREDGRPIYLNLPDFSDDIVAQHVRLLGRQGFVEISDSASLSNQYACEPLRLTWAGHDFLEAIRNDTIWNKNKQQAKEKGGALSFEIIKALALHVGKTLVGL